MRNFRYVLPAGLALAVGVACSDPLTVPNRNNPDRARILANPKDTEAFAGSLFQQINSATLGTIARTQTGMMTASFMNASVLANNGLGPRSNLPRGQIDNGRTNPYASDNYADFRIHQQTSRAAADILAVLATPEFADQLSPAQLARLRSWSYFIYGVSLGNVALVYDSAAVPTPTDGSQDNPANWPALQGYSAVMNIALQQLDSAVKYASSLAIPKDWLRQTGDVSQANYVKLVKSYRARLRANVARTPTERAAVNWNRVAIDADSGITADFTVEMSPAAGWDYQWLATTLHFRDANWHQMTPYVVGMADTSGGYNSWLATERDSRNAFLIRTPDKRFPSGNTRAAQQAVGQSVLPAGVYFRNRSSGDQVVADWRNGQYDHFRWRAFALAGRSGSFPIMPLAEIEMLSAEGKLRLGGLANVTAAIATIDKYRTRNGLPSLVGATSKDDIVPGLTACVPRVPQPPDYTSTACGTVFNAMQWEKLMETAYTFYGAWFLDMRGWGWLPEGTAVHWPVPFQELDARRLPLYNLGGAGNSGGAGPSIFGFGSGVR